MIKINLSKFFPARIKEQKTQEEYEKNGGQYPSPPEGCVDKIMMAIQAKKQLKKLK